MQNSTEPAQPWLAQYPPTSRPSRRPCSSTAPSPRPGAPAAEAAPDRAALRYFDGALTAAELDAASDALAAALQDRGVAKGDRVGVRLQNVPHFPIAMLALWKIGAAVLLVNPMYQKRELRQLVDDSGAVGLIVDEHGLAEATETVEGSTVSWLLSSSSLDHQTRNDERVFADASRVETDADITALVEQFAGRRPEPVDVGPDDIALLTYTSGTTGPPKGAMNTHANVLAVAGSYAVLGGAGSRRRGARDRADLPHHRCGHQRDAGPAARHHARAGRAVPPGRGARRVRRARGHLHDRLDHRLQRPGRGAARRPQPLRVGALPVLRRCADPARHDRALPGAVRSLHPQRLRDDRDLVRGGRRPPGGPRRRCTRRAAPCRSAYRCPAPSPGSSTRRARRSPYGEQGELELSGPAVVPGYWNNPEETERTMPGGRLRTGDGAIMDEDGYVFLVDRLKDQINVSGYKVWPREVEDVLYEHDAVHEAAVVGRSDDYKGEIVIAFVSLEEGAHGRARGARGVRQGAARGVQVPAGGRHHRRPPEDADRQDPAQGAPRRPRLVVAGQTRS